MASRASTKARARAAAQTGAQPQQQAAAVPAALHPVLAAGVVFIASGAVLVLEILAIRLLAPYVGLTLETTTSIIGAVLAGIAAGAALGGWLADRRDPRRLLTGLLVAGGLLALATVPIVRALGPGARGSGSIAAVGITLVALVPVAAFLSAVSPTVAHLQLHDLRASGTIVGRLSAWATAGALVGTFGTGFVLVPLLPTSTSVLVVGVALVAVGLVLGVLTRSLGRATAAGAVASMLLLGALAVGLHSPCDVETRYHCAAVLQDAKRPGGRTLVLDSMHHSFVDINDPAYLRYHYARWIAAAIDASAAPRSPRDAVFIGGGGFTLPRWLLATHPRSRARVLEVDGQLVDLARERLGLRTSRQLRVSVGDARVTMRDVPSASADVVVGDAFGHLAVPWHLATEEWTDEVRRVLRPGGLYALNVIDLRPLRLLHAEAATLLAKFRDVNLVTFIDQFGEPRGGNTILLASDRRLPWRDGTIVATGVSLDRAEVVRLTGGAEPLRDDDAPADQLLTTPKF